MAREFDNELWPRPHLNVAAGVVTNLPTTFACWFQTNEDGADQCLISIGDSAGTYFLSLSAGMSRVGDPVVAHLFSVTGNFRAESTAAISLNTWHHACAIFADWDDRRAYIDGGNKGTDANASAGITLDNTSIAYTADGTPSAALDGIVAEAGIWNVALSDDEVAALGGGISPARIRPESLVAYWPLYGVGSPEPDYRGTYNLTLVETPTTADHAPVQVPFGLDVWLPMGLLLLPHLGGIAWGEQHPTMGEMPEKWSTWSDGAGGSPTVDGDPDWGKLYLACTEEGRSLVYDLANANPRWYTLTENRYGAGSGTATLQIRGSAASFNQDDGEPPNWENYAAPILRSWRYVQARETH